MIHLGPLSLLLCAFSSLSYLAYALATNNFFLRLRTMEKR